MATIYKCDVCGETNTKQQGFLVKSMFTLNWTMIDSQNRSRKFGGSSNYGIDLCEPCKGLALNNSHREIITMLLLERLKELKKSQTEKKSQQPLPGHG